MKKALFVIDVQGCFENEKTKSIARKISNYIENNKGRYSFIVFTVFKNNSKSSLWKFFNYKGCIQKKDINVIEELSDLIDSKDIIFRNTYSLLKVSSVENKLKKLNIEQIDICGFDTDCCVLATI